MDLKTLNLKANFLWHSDSTFLPVPALVNILTARIVPPRAARPSSPHPRSLGRDAPGAEGRIEGRGMWHRQPFAQEDLGGAVEMPMFNKWPPQHWNAVWTNPVNGREALYIASHAFRIDGYDEEESGASR
jgi:alpha-ketoglutarate-dependent 2,4-dichlorophenoxyacetate dioxygenase